MIKKTLISPLSSSNTPPQDYESALHELETIVSQMERGDLPLQGAFNAYQRGFELLSFCQSQLKSLEEQVRVFDEGQLTPFDKPNLS